jgi:hypothetical protein
MKRFRFPKGVRQVKFPFLLNEWTPWQEQIAKEERRLKEMYQLPKAGHWEFEISSIDGVCTIACIIASKW